MHWAVSSDLEDVFHSRLLVALQVRIHAFGQLFMNGAESMCLRLKHKLYKKKHTLEIGHKNYIVAIVWLYNQIISFQ